MDENYLVGYNRWFDFWPADSDVELDGIMPALEGSDGEEGSEDEDD